MQGILASPCHPVSGPGRRAPHSRCSQRCPLLSPGCVTGDPWAPGRQSHPPASAATGHKGSLVSPSSYTAGCSPSEASLVTSSQDSPPGSSGGLTVMVDFPAFLPNLNSNGRVIFFWATIWKPRLRFNLGKRTLLSLLGSLFCSQWLPTSLSLWWPYCWCLNILLNFYHSWAFPSSA